MSTASAFNLCTSVGISISRPKKRWIICSRRTLLMLVEPTIFIDNSSYQDASNFRTPSIIGHLILITLLAHNCRCVIFMLSLFTLQIEHQLLRSSFASLAKQMDLLFCKRLWFIMVEQFLMKYMWGLSGNIFTYIQVYCACNDYTSGVAGLNVSRDWCLNTK